MPLLQQRTWVYNNAGKMIKRSVNVAVKNYKKSYLSLSGADSLCNNLAIKNQWSVGGLPVRS